MILQNDKFGPRDIFTSPWDWSLVNQASNRPSENHSNRTPPQFDSHSRDLKHAPKICDLLLSVATSCLEKERGGDQLPVARSIWSSRVSTGLGEKQELSRWRRWNPKENLL